MRRRDEVASDQGINDPLGPGNELAAIGFTGCVRGGLACRQHQHGERLIGFADKRHHLGPRPWESNAPNVDCIHKPGKRGQHAFHQRRMATEKALSRKFGIFEIGREQEQNSLIWFGGGQ